MRRMRLHILLATETSQVILEGANELGTRQQRKAAQETVTFDFFCTQK